MQTMMNRTREAGSTRAQIAGSVEARQYGSSMGVRCLELYGEDAMRSRPTKVGHWGIRDY